MHGLLRLGSAYQALARLIATASGPPIQESKRSFGSFRSLLTRYQGLLAGAHDVIATNFVLKVPFV